MTGHCWRRNCPEIKKRENIGGDGSDPSKSFLRISYVCELGKTAYLGVNKKKKRKKESQRFACENT